MENLQETMVFTTKIMGSEDERRFRGRRVSVSFPGLMSARQRHWGRGAAVYGVSIDGGSPIAGWFII